MNNLDKNKIGFDYKRIETSLNICFIYYPEVTDVRNKPLPFELMFVNVKLGNE